MLPWLFALLVVLNGAMFLWGYQREKSQEPELPPVPKGQYQIVLMSEVQHKEPTAQAPAHEARDAAEPAGSGFGWPERLGGETPAPHISTAPEPTDNIHPQAPLSAPEIAVGSTATPPVTGTEEGPDPADAAHHTETKASKKQETKAVEKQRHRPAEDGSHTAAH
ncbi:MAG: hypothetical protein WCA32_12640 [Chromatiaceae bacterium]